MAILNQLTSAGSAVLYLPVRLTDGSAFYTASGGGGGPASSVKIVDSAGSALLVVDSSGKIGINNFPSDYLKQGQPILIQTSSETGFLVIDSNGRIGINNFPSDYFKAGQSIGNAYFKVVDSAGTALLVVDSNGRIGVNNFPSDYFKSGQNIGNTYFKIVDSAGSSFLVIDSSGKIGINALPNLTIGSQLPSGSNTIGAVNIIGSGGTGLLIIDSSGRITVVPVQTMRTNLSVKPEREDLTSLYFNVSPNAAGVQVVAGVSGKVIKVYDAGYHAGVSGIHYFYFGISTTPPAGAKAFCTVNGAIPIHKTFVQPRVSSSGDALYLYASVNESSGVSGDVGYVQE